MPFVFRKSWDKGRPTGPFALNTDCAQAQSLKAWWPMWERGGYVHDWSNNLYTLTPNGGVVWKPDQNQTASDSITRRSQGMVPYFSSASSQYLQHAGAVVTAEAFSLVSWCLVNDIVSTYTPLSLGVSSGTARHQIALVATDQTLRASSINSVGTAADATATRSYVANEWVHAVAVYASATDRRMFLNGGSKGTNTTSITVSGLDRTTLGARYSGGALGAYLNGRISDSRIYNKTLSDAEVYLLFDPATRWQLYYPLGRKSWMFVGKAAAVAGSTNRTGPLWMP